MSGHDQCGRVGSFKLDSSENRFWTNLYHQLLENKVTLVRESATTIFGENGVNDDC
jgi:hypothetical protein